MTSSDRRLLHHLAWVVVLKLLVLVGLWQAFVADQRVPVDEATMSTHIEARPADGPAPQPPQGAHP